MNEIKISPNLQNFMSNSESSDIPNSIQNVEHFETIVKQMYVANNNEKSRLYVLELLARDVCKINPSLSKSVWESYVQTMDTMLCKHKEYQKLCWFGTSPKKSDVLSHAFDVLCSLLKAL